MVLHYFKRTRAGTKTHGKTIRRAEGFFLDVVVPACVEARKAVLSRGFGGTEVIVMSWRLHRDCLPPAAYRSMPKKRQLRIAYNCAAEILDSSLFFLSYYSLTHRPLVHQRQEATRSHNMSDTQFKEGKLSRSTA